jgi:catechol 2,3-dioxygenase-like lactoylglutathione lyase family enzyme
MKSETTFLQGNIKGLQHLGIPVTSLPASVAFYTRLGFSVIHNSHVDVPEENDRLEVAFIEHQGVVIELYQVTERNREAIASRPDGHIDHIAFDVKDVDKAFLELKQAGFDILEMNPVRLDFWERGCKYFTVRGPNGEKLEFNQIL